MNAIQSRLLTATYEVVVRDEELDVPFMVTLDQTEGHNVSLIINPEDDLSPLDYLNADTLLMMQDIALNEAVQIHANG